MGVSALRGDESALRRVGIVGVPVPGVPVPGVPVPAKHAHAPHGGGGGGREGKPSSEFPCATARALDGVAPHRMGWAEGGGPRDAGVHRVYLAHRLGSVPVGEASLVVVAAAPHRAPALAAVSALVDAVKAGVPAWKREWYADGGHAWKENAECCWAATAADTAAATAADSAPSGVLTTASAAEVGVPPPMI
jgi:hypothetical protein